MTPSALGNGLLRTLGVVVYVTIALFALAAGGLFVSTLTENAIAAMASAPSASPCSRRCSTPCRSCRRSTRPCSPTTGSASASCCAPRSATTDLARWTALHLAYAAIFLSLAWSRITTKDVTS